MSRGCIINPVSGGHGPAPTIFLRVPVQASLGRVFLVLLGLLREENCFAAEFLHERGVRLASTREELMRIPHSSSATEEFVRERGPLPKDVIELQTQIGVIFRRVEDVVAECSCEGSEYSQEEGKLREKLRLLCRQHGLPDWLYEQPQRCRVKNSKQSCQR